MRRAGNDLAGGRTAAPRILHLELVRAVAIFLVMFNHTGSRGFDLAVTTNNEVAYPFFLALSILCKMAVPLFLMVSGALLIPKDESLGTVYRKRVLRMVAVTVLFSFILYLYKVLTEDKTLDMADFLTRLYSSPVHFSYWYLYMYIGILIMLPFLRALARNITDTDFFYLLGLSILFTGVWPILQYVAPVEGLERHLTQAAPFFVRSILFFVMGYFVEKRLAPRLQRKHIALLIGLSVVAVAITGVVSWIAQTRTESLQEAQQFYATLNAIPTITTYILIRRALKSTPPRVVQGTILWLGGAAFGVYLLESIARGQLDFVYRGLEGPLGSMLAALIWITVSLLVCAFVVSLLKRLPVFKKLL